MRSLLILALIASPAFATNQPSTPSQTQQQSQQQSQDQSASVVNRDHRQAPSISAPPVYASGPCAVGASGGISTPVGGISGGKIVFDADCNRRELARVLTPLNPALALKVLCADPMVAAVATSADCTYKTPDAAPLEKPAAAGADAAVSCATPETVTAAFKACVSK